MISTWEQFEIESTEYLNRKFGNYASFELVGGSDSTVSDIEVRTRRGKHFFIEAKHCPAQCGQFVLLPNVATGTFEYSRLNATRRNRYVDAIMEHMDENFEAFKEAGTRGMDIIMKNGSEIFAAWIVQTYKDKGADFIITNGNTILFVDDFSDYFNVTAKYRVKRSGSGSVGRGNLLSVSRYIRDNYAAVQTVESRGDKVFVTASRNMHDIRFVLNGWEYMFSQRGSEYEIRRLSNTFNANVIFSITQKNARGLSDQEFISLL